MSECKPEIRGRANKNLSEILRAFRVTTQAKVADLMGISETTVSRLKDNAIPEFAVLLAACGLKVVSENAQTHSPERIAALTTLALEALKNDGHPSQFGGDT